MRIIAKRNNYAFPVVCGIIIFIVFLVYNISYQQPWLYVGLAILFGVLFLLDNQQIMLLLCLIVPSVMMLKPTGSDLSLLSYYLLVVALKYFMGNKDHVHPSLLIHLFSVVITSLLYMQYSHILSATRAVVFFLLISSQFKNGLYKNNNYNAALIACYIIGIMANILGGIIYYHSKNLNIFNHLFAGVRNDRNYFSSILSIGIVLSIGLLSVNRKLIYVCLPCLLLNIYYGILSGSRTFFLSLIFSVLMLYALGKNKRTISVAVCLVLVSIVVVLINWDKIYEPLLYTLGRFSEDDVSTGSFRTTAWKFFIDLTCSSPIRFLFGNGLSTLYLDQTQFVEHNTFIQVFSNFGILGSISLVLVYFSVYSQFVNKNLRKPMYIYMPLLCTCFCHFFISALYAIQFDFSIFVSFLFIRVYQYNGIDVEESSIALMHQKGSSESSHTKR